MKVWIKLILFLFTFAIEIKVKAAEVFREPHYCDQKAAIECLIFSGNVGGKVRISDTSIYLGRDTLVFRDLQNRWHLIRGVLKVETNGKFQMNTIVGKFDSDHAQYILQQLEDKTHLFVLAGKVQQESKSPVSSPFYLTAGYSNWYGPINSLGVNEEGLPRPIVWKKFANQIGFENWYLILGEKRKIKDNEPIAVENASSFYLDVLQAIEKIRLDRQAAEENKLRAHEEEARNIRRLFRKKFEVENIDE